MEARTQGPSSGGGGGGEGVQHSVQVGTILTSGKQNVCYSWRFPNAAYGSLRQW